MPPACHLGSPGSSPGVPTATRDVAVVSLAEPAPWPGDAPAGQMCAWNTPDRAMHAIVGHQIGPCMELSCPALPHPRVWTIYVPGQQASHSTQYSIMERAPFGGLCHVPCGPPPCGLSPMLNSYVTPPPCARSPMWPQSACCYECFHGRVRHASSWRCLRWARF